MATTLLLLSAGPTRSSRVGAFALPTEGLDAPGRRAATACRLPARFRDNVLTSPWRAARETAELIGVAGTVQPALADLDPGSWGGCSFTDIAARDSDRLSQWIADARAGAPGGESMAHGVARVAPLIDALRETESASCWITHPMMIRAALSHMLGFPLIATLAIDIAPLASARLSFNGKWRLQALSG